MSKKSTITGLVSPNHSQFRETIPQLKYSTPFLFLNFSFDFGV